MRKIILSMVVSLDGFIEDSVKSLDWHLWDKEIEKYMINFFAKIDTIIVGRIAYQQMADYWPTANSENPVITSQMNSLKKIVYSKTLKQSDWNNTVIESEIDPSEVLEWKKQKGKDMVIFGGAEIASAFIEQKLVDEYQIMVMPVLLGSGTPLFKNNKSNMMTKLSAVKVKAFTIGAVSLYYKLADK